MYRFSLVTEIGTIVFPIPPSVFKTDVGGKSRIYTAVNGGQFSMANDIELRSLYIKVLFPKDDTLCDDKSIFNEPIYYLGKLREIKALKKPMRFVVSRVLPDGNKIFDGNMCVTLENYTVNENAGENGDFWAELYFREYRYIKSNDASTGKSNDGSYKIKAGDSLWNIAKKYLGDGSKYKVLAELNGITDYNHLKTGTVIRLE